MFKNFIKALLPAFLKNYNRNIFKERLHLAKGHTQEAAAKLFGIETTAIKEWKKRRSSGEGLETRIRRRKPKKLKPVKLRTYVSDNPDAYISEIAGGFSCSCSTVRKTLKKLGLQVKKTRACKEWDTAQREISENHFVSSSGNRCVCG